MMFYLVTPIGELLVNRNGALEPGAWQSSGGGTLSLATGLPRDEGMYGKYPKGHKEEINKKVWWGPLTEEPDTSLRLPKLDENKNYKPCIGCIVPPKPEFSDKSNHGK